MLRHITKLNPTLIFLIFITIFVSSCSKSVLEITKTVGPDGELLLIESNNISDIENHKSYYKNGGLEYEAEIRNGVPDGISKYWSIEGHLLNISNYENGKLHGTSIRFFENEKIASKTEYFYGDIHGVSETFYENGKIKSHQIFKYGEPISILLRFNKYGKRIYQP